MMKINLNIGSGINIIHQAIDVSDALEKIFANRLHVVTIAIENSTIELPLCYNFSELLDDFLAILIDVKSNSSGAGLYGFRQNQSFDGDWELKWENDMLEINFEWRQVAGHASFENFPVNDKMSRSQFIEEWKTLFKQLMPYIKSLEFEYRDQLILMEKFVNN